MNCQQPSQLKEEIQKKVSSNQLFSGLTPFTLKSEHWKKKEEGKSCAWLCHSMLLEGMYLCVVGDEGDIYAWKRKLCSGTKGQTYLSAYDKNQKEIFH